MAKTQYPYYKRQRPNTSIVVDDSALGSVASDSVKNLVLVGSSEGGQPNVLYQLTSFPQARAIFKSGELLDAIEMAWNPSDVEAGSGVIYAMRADNAKQAKLEKGQLLFESEQYGDITNKLTVELSDNALTQTKRLRIRDLSTNDVEVFDHLGSIFTLAYEGTDAIATATIAEKVLTISTGAGSDTLVEQLRYDLTSPAFATVSRILTDISSHEGFTATFVPYGEKNIASAELDDVESADIKGKGATFTGLAGDIINQTQFSQFVRVSRVEGNTDPIVNFPQTPLAGGTKGELPTSWAPLFQAVALDDTPLTYYMVPLSSLASVHAEAVSFVNEQTNNGYTMRAVMGGAVNETYSQTVARQAVLYNGRATLIGFDANVRMSDGRVVTQPAYMMAAMVAGIASGLPIGEPITYKQIRVASLTRPYTSDQLDQLHLNGVVVAEKVRNLSTTSTFRIVSDVTTFNVDTDPVKFEMSLGEETDFLVMELRETLDKTFIGTRILAVGADSIKTHIISFLGRKKLSGQIQDFDSSNIAVVIIRDRAEISFVVNPARGLNHINANMIYESATLTAQ